MQICWKIKKIVARKERLARRRFGLDPEDALFGKLLLTAGILLITSGALLLMLP